MVPGITGTLDNDKNLRQMGGRQGKGKAGHKSSKVLFFFPVFMVFRGRSGQIYYILYLSLSSFAAFWQHDKHDNRQLNRIIEDDIIQSEER